MQNSVDKTLKEIHPRLTVVAFLKSRNLTVNFATKYLFRNQIAVQANCNPSLVPEKMKEPL